MVESFIRGFRKEVEKTIEEYCLIEDDELVLVAVSGGKDSTTALEVLKTLGHDTEAIIIEQLLGDYSKRNLANIESFCSKNDIRLHKVSMMEEYGFSVCYIKSVLKSRGQNLKSCHICGVIRRDILNRWGKKLKADKIATGHNLDDEAQNHMMNFMQGNLAYSARLGPKSGLGPHKGFIQRIKPLYFQSEEDCATYSRMMGFPVVYEPCPCASDSFRTCVKSMLNELETRNPAAKRNIVETFMKLMPKTRENRLIRECAICFEPSSKRLCRKCEILSLMSDNTACKACESQKGDKRSRN